MYVIYTDSIFMDSGAITAFNPLLKLQPFRKVAKVSYIMPSDKLF